MEIIKFISEYFKKAETVKIRSSIIHFQGAGKHTFRGDVLNPYSFELINTGNSTLISEGNEILQGGGGADSRLNFPRIGTFKRSDIFVFEFDNANTGAAYIRFDSEQIQ